MMICNPKKLKLTNKLPTGLLAFGLVISLNASASDLSISNTFSANTPAVAAEINQNFSDVETSVNDNDARLDALEVLVTSMQTTINDQQAVNIAQQSTITQLQSDLAAVESNTVLSLDGKLQLATINGYDTAEFTAINVQINSGIGYTAGPVNGLGNLTIGYNEIISNAPEFCSDPQYDNSVDCSNNSEIWDNNVRRGSHNLIIGLANSYDDYGSFVAGSFNIINAAYTSVTGGFRNTASGLYASVSGGENNTANNSSSSVSGGQNNTASGYVSSVNGGRENTASGVRSSVSGGEDNTAVGLSSTLSGGFNRVALGTFNWVAGSLLEVD